MASLADIVVAFAGFRWSGICRPCATLCDHFAVSPRDPDEHDCFEGLAAAPMSIRCLKNCLRLQP